MADTPSINILAEGSTQFKAYYLRNKPPPPVLDPVTSAFYDAVSKYYEELKVRPSNIEDWRLQLELAGRQTFGITPEDLQAIRSWTELEFIGPGLRTTIGKINPIQSWVIATTPLSDEALTALKAGAKGWISNGEPGVYTLKGEL